MQNYLPIEPPRIDLIAFGQNAEDVMLCRAFQDAPADYYVDLGAGHPVYGSITRNLYHHLGWRGLEVEPIHELAALLAEDRPRSTTAPLAVGTAAGRSTFYECTTSWALSTTDPVIHEMHLASGHRFVEHEVPVVPINELLASHNVPENFAVLKSDIEGIDLEVLGGLDWDRWRPRVVVVETIQPGTHERIDSEITAMLGAHGYDLALFDGINSFYVSAADPVLGSRLSVPFNKLDYAIPLRWWHRLAPGVRADYPHLLAALPDS